jgi:2-(1,2-epoxy-1,2-dihydrophenyl)acetyl-CoA isomerase
MAFEHILFEVRDAVARLTLNRPDRLNSFNDAMHAEVRDALAALRADASVRVLLLTGAGRGFCAGQDLGDRAVAPGGAAVDLGASIERNYRPLVLALRALPVPTVCAVNGVAAGAGANLALACDLVVATRSASFIQAFAKIGLIPDSGGTFFLPRLVGRARAMGLAMLGDKLSADDAAAWGLIWRAVDDAEFVSTVDKLCAQLASAPTRRAGRRSGRRSTPPRTTRSRRSSTASATCSASSGTPRITAKAWPRSPRSARRGSPGASLAAGAPLARDAAVAVLGAGAMGAGIAQVAAQAGHRVLLYDARTGAADEARAKLAATLDGLAAKGKLSADEAKADRLARRADPHARRVRERGLGDRGDRRGARRQARAVPRPRGRHRARRDHRVEHLVALDHRARRGHEARGRVAGMHFFNRRPLMPWSSRARAFDRPGRPRHAVRDRRGVGQDAGARDVDARLPSSTAARGRSTARRCGCSRKAQRRRRRSTRCCATAAAFAWGPFELMDLIGHDVNYAVTRSVWEAMYTIRATRPRRSSASSSPPGTSGASPDAASTTTRPGATTPAPQVPRP